MDVAAERNFDTADQRGEFSAWVSLHVCSGTASATPLTVPVPAPCIVPPIDGSKAIFIVAVMPLCAEAGATVPHRTAAMKTAILVTDRVFTVSSLVAAATAAEPDRRLSKSGSTRYRNRDERRCQQNAGAIELRLTLTGGHGPASAICRTFALNVALQPCTLSNRAPSNHARASTSVMVASSCSSS